MDINSLHDWIRAGVTILGLLGSFITVLKKYKNDFLKAYDKRIEVFENETGKRIEILEREIQRVIMHNDNMDIQERINAGQRYKELGGNGSSELYLENLKERYRNTLDAEQTLQSSGGQK